MTQVMKTNIRLLFMVNLTSSKTLCILHRKSSFFSQSVTSSAGEPWRRPSWRKTTVRNQYKTVILPYNHNHQNKNSEQTVNMNRYCTLQTSHKDKHRILYQTTALSAEQVSTVTECTLPLHSNCFESIGISQSMRIKECSANNQFIRTLKNH